MPPALPIRLITALPLLRRGLRVTSGISATAGERKVAMEISSSTRIAIKRVTAWGCSLVCAWAYAWRAGAT